MNEHTLQNEFQEIYQEMVDRNSRELETKGVKLDQEFNAQDQRKGIGIFAFYESTPSPEFVDMYQEAELLFPDQVLYSPLSYHPRAKRASFYVGQLHFTFFQVHFAVPLLPTSYTDRFDAYAESIAKGLFKLTPFQIDFHRLIAIPTGLLLAGTPTEDINAVRDQVRASLAESSLQLQEPYKSDIAHSTFLRLANPVDPNSLLEFAKRHTNTHFGSLQITKLQLGLGSWRMAPSEISMKYEFDLQNKKLSQM